MIIFKRMYVISDCNKHDVKLLFSIIKTSTEWYASPTRLKYMAKIVLSFCSKFNNRPLHNIN